MERIPSKKEKEVYYYYTGKKEKKWGYRMRYYDALGKRREKSKQGLPSENAAIRALLEVKAAVFNGETRRVENDQLTVSEWMDIWFEAYKSDWKPATIRLREDTIRLHIKPLLGKYKLSALDRTAYKLHFLNVLSTKLSPGTVRLYHRIFMIAVNAAVRDEIITKNRFSNMRLADAEPDENFLSASELTQFLSFVDQHAPLTHYTIYHLLAYSGFRVGEALGLKWTDVDFEKGTIRVERSRNDKGIGPPKNKRAYRTIAIDQTILDRLTSYKVWVKKAKLRNGVIHKDNHFVFVSSRGTPISLSTLRKSFDRLFQKDGLDIPKITLHGLRHTHATLLLTQGVPAHNVAERLGNTAEMIYEVYGHAVKELEMETVKLFSKAVNS